MLLPTIRKSFATTKPDKKTSGKRSLRRELVLALVAKFIMLFFLWLFFFSGDTELIDTQSVNNKIFNTR
jgi:hypothetical protein